jgi:hypothetical protein
VWPPPGAKTKYCPPAMRLPTHKSTTMGVHIAYEPVSYVKLVSSGKKSDDRTTSKWAWKLMSSKEDQAFQNHKLMNKSTFTKSDMSAVINALDTLEEVCG